MKKYFVVIMTAILLALGVTPTAANAQTAAPPAATGEVTGTIINQNQGTIVAESLEVMLHVLDDQYVELDMLHAQSRPDGTFRFAEVALEPGRLYAVMAIFEDVVYYSNTVPAVDGSDQLEVDVPVFETTADLSAVQIDQIHVLFNFAPDGLETTEIYILSNSGERTVRGAVTLDDGQLATLRFPLPAGADFIFFQPDEQDRFIKFPGGYADTSPIRPGERSDQYKVDYLVPFSQGQTYSYTAPLGIRTMNFLLPQDAGVSLNGIGLAGPQPFTLESGASFMVYSYSNIPAGQTIEVTFSGMSVLGSQSRSSNSTLPLALGGGLLGLAMIGVGVWWWRRPEDVAGEDNEMDAKTGATTFDDLITQIAQLDETFDRGELDEGIYHRERRRLREQAKSMLDQQERPKASLVDE